MSLTSQFTRTSSQRTLSSWLHSIPGQTRRLARGTISTCLPTEALQEASLQLENPISAAQWHAERHTWASPDVSRNSGHTCVSAAFNGIIARPCTRHDLASHTNHCAYPFRGDKLLQQKLPSRFWRMQHLMAANPSENMRSRPYHGGGHAPNSVSACIMDTPDLVSTTQPGAFGKQVDREGFKPQSLDNWNNPLCKELFTYHQLSRHSAL